MKKQTQLARDYETNEEPMGSDKSLIDSDSTVHHHVKPRLVKSDSNAVIDKKMLTKFNSLIQTLKDTRTNLVTVDQIIARDKRRLRSNKSESSLQEMNSSFQRASSLPPSLRLPDCHLCRGDSCQDQYFLSSRHSHDGDIFKNDFKLSRPCRSMQDLTTVSLKPNDEQAGDSRKGTEDERLSETTYSARETEYSNQHLHQQLEDKENQIQDLSFRLQELTNKLKVSEGHRHQLMLRMEDMLCTPLNMRSEAEHITTEMKRIEELASDEKNRLKKRARKIIQELKEKCKQYATELQRAKEHEWELEQRCNKYSHDHNLLLSQTSKITEKFQVIFKELDDVKLNRHMLESNIEKKDTEIIQINARNQELAQKLLNNKMLEQKYSSEYEELQHKLATVSSEKSKLEACLAAANKELEMSKQTIQELKEEIKGLRTTNSEIQAQLLTESALRQSVDISAQEVMEKLRITEQRLSELQDKYLETLNDHGKTKETLQQEILMQKIVEEKKLQEVLKNQQALYESQFTALKLELAENQAEARTLQDALKKEQDVKLYLKNEISRCKDEFNVLNNKHHQLCKYYLAKKKKLQSKELRIRTLQQKLLEVHDMGKNLEDDFQDILRLIHNDIDLASSILLSKHSDYPVMVSEGDSSLHSRDWLNGIKNKLRWLTDAIKDITSTNQSTVPQHAVSVDNIHKNAVCSSPVRKSNSDTTYNGPQKRFPEFCLHYPFNSTEVREMLNTGNEKEHELMIFKRYHRFRQLFECIHDDSRSPTQPEIHDESSEICPLSTGELSPSSSLSSITAFSCETPVVNEE